MNLTSLFLSEEETLSFIGPPLEEGPLPAFFYFSLSGEESLTLDPYNQPAHFLSQFPLRIFSLNLPYHTPKNHSITPWTHDPSFIQPFCALVEKALNLLFHRRSLLEGKIGVGGLSRGAFLATHLAAHLPVLNPLLGFAPLTLLEQQGTEPLKLIDLVPSLLSKTIRFYVGNHDTRIGTEHTFQFIQALAQAKAKANHRDLDVELYIKPAIGNKGHGTAKETFEEGALWMAKQLGALDG